MSLEAKAYFALACFWKPDGQFGICKGVRKTRVGYCGGTGGAPNYPNVGDHTEAIEIEYDPNFLSYEDLLQLFWRFHDPCTCRKLQYKSAIYYTSEQQRLLAVKSKQQYEMDNERSVLTEILPLHVFYQAEDYHQKYFLRIYHKGFYQSLPVENPLTSTRDARLNGFLAGNGTFQDLQEEKEMLKLTEEQFKYIQKHITKELRPSVVTPMLRTIIQVGWNYCKKAAGYRT